MSSRGAAKKLIRHGKPAGHAKAAKAAKAKPAKKVVAGAAPLEKRAKAPAAKGVQTSRPAPPAAHATQRGSPPVRSQQFLGLPPPLPPGARSVLPAGRSVPPSGARPLAPAAGQAGARPAGPPARPGSSTPVAPPGRLPPAGPSPRPMAGPVAKPAPPGPSTPARQSLARSFYWADLRVGDDLPPLTKPAIDRVRIVRYAAAASDFNRLHLDEPFAQSLGFRGIFAPGALAMGFVGQLLTAWLRRGHVRKLSARFVKIVWPGDELTSHGRIAELRKDDGACYAEVELWAENQKGELVLRGQATCELYESAGASSSESAGLFGLDPAARAHGAAGARPAPGSARPFGAERPGSKPPPPGAKKR